MLNVSLATTMVGEKILAHTVRKKTKRDAVPKHKCDGKFRHPHRFSGPINVDDGFFRSFFVDDGIFRHIYVLVLRCSSWYTLFIIK
jgi:hypothetical protein